MFFSQGTGAEYLIEVGKGGEVASPFQEIPCKTEDKRLLTRSSVGEVSGVWFQGIHRGVVVGKGASGNLYRERGAVLIFRKVRALVWVT